MSGRGRGRGRGRSDSWVPKAGSEQPGSSTSGTDAAVCAARIAADGLCDISLPAGGRGRGRGRGRAVTEQPSAAGRGNAPGRGRGRGRSSGTGVWLPKQTTDTQNASDAYITSDAGASTALASSSTALSNNTDFSTSNHQQTTAHGINKRPAIPSVTTSDNTSRNTLKLGRQVPHRNTSSTSDQGAAQESAAVAANSRPTLAGSSSVSRSSSSGIVRTSSGSDDKEHKVQATAVASRFCPVRGMQQVLSQLSRQASDTSSRTQCNNVSNSLTGPKTATANGAPASSSNTEAAAVVGMTSSTAAPAAPAAVIKTARPVAGSSSSSSSRSNSGTFSRSSQDWRSDSSRFHGGGGGSSSLRPIAAAFSTPMTTAADDSFGSDAFGPADDSFGAAVVTGSSSSSNWHGNLSASAPSYQPGSSSNKHGGAFGSGSSSSTAVHHARLSVNAPTFQPGSSSSSSRQPGAASAQPQQAGNEHLTWQQQQQHLRPQQQQPQLQQRKRSPPQQPPPPLQPVRPVDTAAAAATAALAAAAASLSDQVLSCPPGDVSSGPVAAAGPVNAAASASGLDLTEAVILDYVSTGSSRGRGRGRGRSIDSSSSSIADPAAAGRSGRSGGRGSRSGRGAAATVTPADAADSWRVADVTAAAGSSSARSAGSSSGRGRGRGRGRDMRGYVHAGSRIENSLAPAGAEAAPVAATAAAANDDSAAAAAAPASATAASGSAAAADYDALLPADEDALFDHASSSSTADATAATGIDQQGQQQGTDNAAGAGQEVIQQPSSSSGSSSNEQAKVTQEQGPAPTTAQASAAANTETAAAPSGPAAPPPAAAAAKEDVDKLTCVVCLEHPSAIAVGPCDHHQLCALCCLRLRLCYHDNRCPLCKTEAKQVVIITTPKGTRTIPSFNDLIAQKATLWQKPKWAAGVLARTDDLLPFPHNRSGRIPVHVRLLQMTAMACPECDKFGERPMPHIKVLQEHLSFVHGGKQMCRTCVKARRKFPLELETYTPQALEAHKTAAHKHCEFCDMWFYAIDEVWAHMNQNHFLCSICQAAGTPHLYFKDSAGLRDHYVAKHFPCTEGECGESGMVAFATEQELKDHQLERHSSKMPRFKKSNARQLVLDLPTIIPRHTGRAASWREQQQSEQQPQQLQGAGSSGSSNAPIAAAAAGSSSRGRGSRRQQQHGSSSQLHLQDEWPSVDTAVAGGGSSSSSTGFHRTVSASNVATAPAAAAAGSSSSGSAAAVTAEPSGTAGANASNMTTAAAAAAADPYANVTSLGEGGMHIIDDDVGMNYDFSQQQQQHSTQEQQQEQEQQQQQWPTPSGDGPVFASSSTSRHGTAAAGSSNAAVTEEFPDLAAASGADGSSRAADGSRSAAAAAAAPGAQLVKATAKCACGRRQMHLAVKQGQQPPSLPCDKECERLQRRSQIADAFGIENAEQHAAYWDKHRTPSYSPQLLQAYKHDPVFIEQLERQFVDFLGGGKSTRLTLGTMSKAQRAVVHEYAEQGFGFVSHSTGVEPNRVVQVFRTPSSGAPTQLLSQAAVLVSQQAIDNMLKQQAASALTLRLVDVTPGAHLAHHLREWQGQYTMKTECPGVVQLTFSDPKVFKACSDALAGGIRGVFKVDRSSTGSIAAAAAGSTGSTAAPSSSSTAQTAARVSGSSSSNRVPAAAGWQTASKGKGKAAASGTAAAAALPPDPWADDDAPTTAAPAAVVAPVADDWEALLAESQVDVPRGPALRLQQSNMWDALQQAE